MGEQPTISGGDPGGNDDDEDEADDPEHSIVELIEWIENNPKRLQELNQRVNEAINSNAANTTQMVSVAGSLRSESPKQSRAYRNEKQAVEMTPHGWFDTAAALIEEGEYGHAETIFAALVVEDDDE